MDGSRTDRSHSVRKADGLRQSVAAMGEIDRERVRWATGSFTGVYGLGGETVGGTGFAAVEDGCTLGGAITLGGGTTLGGGDVVGAVSRGASTVVVVVQLVKRSQILEMANSCLWWNMVASSLTAQDRKLRAWTILPSGVTSGSVRYLWSTSIVSEMMMDLVVALTT